MQFNRANPMDLQAFLQANSAKPATFDQDGTAHFVNNFKGQQRPVFAADGYWIRAIGPGQFSVCNKDAFDLTYQLVDEADNQPIQMGVLAGMTEEQAQQLASQINSIRVFEKGRE